MDSDYLISLSESKDTDKDIDDQPTIFDTMTEDDFSEVTQSILELIDEYMMDEILHLSSPYFYTTMQETISGFIHDELLTFDVCDGSDETYGEITEIVEVVMDVYLSFTKHIVPKRQEPYTYHIDRIVDIDRLTSHIKYLQNIIQPAQKSKEWYEFRSNLISASNLWKVFGTEAQCNSLIYEKCQPSTSNPYMQMSTDSAMHWGNKYEPVTVMVYEDMFSTMVGEFGCIQHSKHPFIGASPDGINIDPTNHLFGRMLEIKNIVNREITGIPKEEYWVQTQIQMEVCDLDECDFMETRFLEYPSADEFYGDLDNVDREYRGVILHFIEKDLKVGSMPIYKYMPFSVALNKESIDEWTDMMRQQNRANGLVLFTTIYWYLEEYSCVLIQRNRRWFASAVSKIEEVWRIIEKERVEGFEHRNSKKKISIKMSTDLSNSYMIQNMPLQNSICLVKLD
jgi:hypothetical protein